MARARDFSTRYSGGHRDIPVRAMVAGTRMGLGLPAASSARYDTLAVREAEAAQCFKCGSASLYRRVVRAVRGYRNIGACAGHRGDLMAARDGVNP